MSGPEGFNLDNKQEASHGENQSEDRLGVPGGLFVPALKEDGCMTDDLSSLLSGIPGNRPELF